MSKCQSCHHSNSPNRNGAPENVSFDTQSMTDEWIDAIHRTVITQQSMPPSGGITNEELILLEQWIECSNF